MLQGEHSAILWSFITLPCVIKIYFFLFLSGRFTQVLLYITNPYPAKKIVLKMSACYVCIYSNALETIFITKANNMNPDQTAQEQFELDPYCLQYKLQKYISR